MGSASIVNPPLWQSGGAGHLPYIDAEHDGTEYHVFARLLAPGLVGYSVCEAGYSWGFGFGDRACHNPGEFSFRPSCTLAGGGLLGAPFCVLDVVTGGAVSLLANCQQGGCNNRQFLQVGINLLPYLIGPGAELGEDTAVDVSASLGTTDAGTIGNALDHAASGNQQPFVRVEVNGKPYLEDAAQGASLFRKLEQDAVKCGTCFPADTQVATAGGEVAIQTLRPGDTVLAEDPKTDEVQSEPVQALLVHQRTPYLELELSDGTTLKVTSNHPMYVDDGPGLTGTGWLEAGQLVPGDRLRTENGKDVTVLAVRWNVGDAIVYTLTVAVDHSFFVDAAEVLVHNAYCGSNILHQNGTIGEYHAYQDVISNQGQIGIKAPGPITANGPDFITYDPVNKTVFAWDAKYRGPGSHYPATVSAATLARWLPDVRAAVNKLPAGSLRDTALNALSKGNYNGAIFPYLK